MSLSGNDIVFTLKAKTDLNVPFESKGGSVALQITDTFVDEDTFQIDMYKNGHRFGVYFIFTDNANAVNTYPHLLPTEGVFLNAGFEDYLAQLAVRIMSHPFVSAYFERVYIQNDDPIFSIIFEEKAGSDFVLDMNHTLANSASVDVQPPVASLKPAGHRILFELLCENGFNANAYDTILSIETPTDDKGVVHLNVKDAIHSYLTDRISDTHLLPDFNSNVPQIAKNLYRFYIRICEKWGIDDGTDWAHTEFHNPYFVRFGGIAQQIINDYPTAISTLEILSFYPTNKTVRATQPEYLAYQAQNDGQQVKVSILEILIDGSVNSYFKHDTGVLTLKKYDTLLLPIGAAQLGIFSNVQAYRVAVTDMSGAALTATYTYVIDSNNHESERYLQYINGFGVPQTVRCVGVYTKNTDFEKQYAQVLPVAGVSVFSRSGKKVTKTEAVEKWTYRTGYLYGLEYQTIIEILSAKRVYEVQEIGYIPLALDKISVKENETAVTLYTLDITATPSVPRDFFTNNTLLPTASDSEEANYTVKW